MIKEIHADVNALHEAVIKIYNYAFEDKITDFLICLPETSDLDLRKLYIFTDLLKDLSRDLSLNIEVNIS